MATTVVLKKLTHKQQVALKRILRVMPNNVGIFLVGGTVRDFLLKRPTKDLDLVVTSIPLQRLARLLQPHGNVKKVGARFGVLLFRPKGTSITMDIALPRTEHAFGTGGYRDFLFATDPTLPIEHDLARRDFTVNAMAWNLRKKTLVDPFHGQKDLRNKVLCAVGKPQERFQEDYSRLLRLVRFVVQLGFSVERKTAEQAVRLMPQLNERRKGMFVVPREVIAEQFLRTVAEHPQKALDAMERFRVLDVLLPELAHLKHCTQSKDFHSEGNAFQHTRKALSRLGSAAWDKAFGNSVPLVVIIGTMLHDIGKPSCKQLIRQHGKLHVSFQHHDERGATSAVAIVRRLKLSSFQGEVDNREIGWLIQHHMTAVRHLEHPLPRRVLAERFVGERGLHLLQLIWADCGASLEPNHHPSLQPYRQLRKELDGFLMKRNGVYIMPKPLITGHDLIAWFHMRQSPMIGKVLALAEEAQLQGNIHTQRQARIFAQRLLERGS